MTFSIEQLFRSLVRTTAHKCCVRLTQSTLGGTESARGASERDAASDDRDGRREGKGKLVKWMGEREPSICGIRMSSSTGASEQHSGCNIFRRV